MTALRLWLARAAPGTARPLGRQLLRLAVARTAGVSPDALGEPVRSCLSCDDRLHGPPRWPGSGVWASLSRAGPLVAVAAVPAPSPPSAPAPVRAEHGLGVDLVVGTGRLVPAPSDLLSVEERRLGARARPLRLWARKEAVVKATGLGLALPVGLVSVSDHDDGAWSARLDPHGAGAVPHGGLSHLGTWRLSGADVDVSPVVGTGHHAAVALVGEGPVTAEVSDASELLGRP